MNSTVELRTSGLLWGSPYDLVTGLYMNSSGTGEVKEKSQFESAITWTEHVDLSDGTRRTIVDPVAQVALPPALVQECDEGVDVGATGAAAHDGVGRDHR